ncbi:MULTISPECIES: hypothetical protein [unclassified Methylobacterium]|jgi:hypothetical protein|uniref:hypothetical protein n=1 Tax=unclassified Methylobacterium TaxID=2615210 RepID=UPI001355B7B0|nr:hypothetical protein [Methylobacterium sp. 2A]MWV22497.1 hypothetical protein [Methylobacterium sp. 2A]
MAGGVLAGAVAPVRAAGALAIQDTHLHTPPDSHEPQRAQIALRNAGADPVTQVTILCTFTGAGGAVLDTQTVSVPDIAGGAAVQAEAIYYGYPRASGAACRITGPD